MIWDIIDGMSGALILKSFGPKHISAICPAQVKRRTTPLYIIISTHVIISMENSTSLQYDFRADKQVFISNWSVLKMFNN